MQRILSLSPRAKQAHGNFQHLAAASSPTGDGMAGKLHRAWVKSADQIADQKCALERVIIALFGV